MKQELRRSDINTIRLNLKTFEMVGYISTQAKNMIFNFFLSFFIGSTIFETAIIWRKTKKKTKTL
jgi:hypothetical protein